MPFVKHDEPPPPHWPSTISYLNKCRLTSDFPPTFFPFLIDGPTSTNDRATLNARVVKHPQYLAIRLISGKGHPANGQAGLFAKKKIAGGELIIPYLGVIHMTLIPASTAEREECLDPGDEREHSDYDLSLHSISAYDPLNPFPGRHVSIGVDAQDAGNAARFVNDYRGIASEPNAEFRLGKGEGGEKRMEIWSLKQGVGKGQEILVSYGKSWWSARKS